MNQKTTDQKLIEAAAEKYFNVAYEGLNERGQKMYSSDNMKDLCNAEGKIKMFQDIVEWRDKNPSPEVLALIKEVKEILRIEGGVAVDRPYFIKKLKTSLAAYEESLK